MEIKVKTGLRDSGGRPFMGIGLVRLLRGAEKAGSLSGAASEMGMSWSKAHKLIKRLEAALGRRVLARVRGGSLRGGSSLTPRGLEFLRRYEKLDAAVLARAETLFRKAFPGGRP